MATGLQCDTRTAPATAEPSPGEPEERASLVFEERELQEAPAARPPAASGEPLPERQWAWLAARWLLLAACGACLVGVGLFGAPLLEGRRSRQEVFRRVEAPPVVESSTTKVAVLIQAAQCSKSPLLHEGGAVFEELVSECLGSIAAAAAELNWTVSVSLAVSPECHSEFLPAFGSFPVLGEASIHEVPGHTNAEMLAWQLEEAKASGAAHDLALLLGADEGADVARRAVQSLCGTPAQVHSVQRLFAEKWTLGLVAPLGTVVTNKTSTDDILPWLRQRRFKGEAACDSAVSGARLARFGGNLSEWEGAVAVVGGMYWARWGQLDLGPRPAAGVVELSKALRLQLGSHTPDGKDAQKSLLEVYVPTALRLLSLRLAEIPPAPKPMALYFPQYHPIPENDKFWGKNFTEWTLLRPCQVEGIRKPLGVEAGGLGYYDLRDASVRAKQAEMARKYGVHGFVYYHYWFSSVEGEKVMFKVPELRLEDGQPDVPFMLSWANEAWTRRWDGSTKTDNNTLLAQSYGSADDWARHFRYLLRFFKHPKYIRVEGKPAFALYRAGLMEDSLKPMLRLWEGLARDSGLPGLHVIVTMAGKFGKKDSEELRWTHTPLIEAAFHFPSLQFCCWDADNKSTWPPAPAEGKRPCSTVANSPAMSQATQYWGATAGFDNRPRHPGRNETDNGSVLEPWMFRVAVEASLQSMSQQGGRDVQDNLYFIGSWNEWNEQSVLEPSDVFGFGFLEALLSALRRVPARMLEDW